MELWFKILNMGGSCKIVKMVQAKYSSVKSCVRTYTSNNVNSAYLDSFMGVKQGEPMSPFLFICFINDIYTFIKDGSFDIVNIDELHLLILLFADDTVLFSYSKEGLQFQLNQLYTCCSNWTITVNIANKANKRRIQCCCFFLQISIVQLVLSCFVTCCCIPFLLCLLLEYFVFFLRSLYTHLYMYIYAFK